MGDVIPFRRKPAEQKSTLCQNNHHKWKALKESRFDVQQGRLVTVERCTRCGKTRNRLT